MSGLTTLFIESNLGLNLNRRFSPKLRVSLENPPLTQASEFKNKNQLSVEKSNHPSTACADSTNLKVNRVANISELEVSDIEYIEDILTLEFIKAI